MSKATEAWVWDCSPTSGNDRLVLLYLADQADDDGGSCYPSIDTLARKARVQRNTVLEAIRRLEEVGEIIVLRAERRGRGHHNRYVITMGRPWDEIEPVVETEAIQGTYAPLVNGSENAPFSGPGNGAEKARSEPLKGAEKARKRRGLTAPYPYPDPKANPNPPPLAPRPATKTLCPDPFVVSPEMQAWVAEKLPSVDFRVETEQFVDHHRGKGNRMVDWTAAWRTWMRNAAKWARGGQTGDQRRLLRNVDQDRGRPSGLLEAP